LSKKNQGEVKKLCGKDGFESYYSQIFGERWESLKESFAGENKSVEYKIPGAQKSYFLDSASIVAALALPLDGAEKILDLCAAPGGKTLVLASRMPKAAELFSNERSPERKHRLATVVSECLTESISKRITVSCSDGATWCRRQSECFDRILLDAPCSSERHVYLDSKYLDVWSVSRIKTVSMAQWALLSCAFRLLSPGGILVYSTCAMNQEENDLMIEKLWKKFNKTEPAFEILKPELYLEEVSPFVNFSIPFMEKTKFGQQILPDKADGAGPIYFSVIKKF